MDRRYRIGVLTEDAFLFQKIKLGLLCSAEVIRAEDGEGFDAVIFDSRAAFSRPDGVRVITLSGNNGEGDMSIPFDTEELWTLIEGAGAPEPIRLSAEKRRVYLGGEEIKLTEIELNVLTVLLEGGGDYVSREELLNRVWGGNADMGVVNVYIHYLREKLEKSGEKVILSSRRCGYKISDKYVTRT